MKFLQVNRLVEEKECHFWSTDILPNYFSPAQLRPLLSRYSKKKRYTSTYKSQHFFCYNFFWTEHLLLPPMCLTGVMKNIACSPKISAPMFLCLWLKICLQMNVFNYEIMTKFLLLKLRKVFSLNEYVM